MLGAIDSELAVQVNLLLPPHTLNCRMILKGKRPAFPFLPLLVACHKRATLNEKCNLEVFYMSRLTFPNVCLGSLFPPSSNVMYKFPAFLVIFFDFSRQYFHLVMMQNYNL